MAAFVLPLITGLAGLFGGKKQQQSSTSTTNSDQNYNGFNSPFLTGGQAKLQDTFSNDAINRFNQGIPDLKGFEAGGLQTINNGADLKSKILSNMISQRGLSFSPAAAYPQVLNESDRVNQGTSFLNTIPMVQRQFQDENFANLISAFKNQPIASTTSGNQEGSSTTQGTQTNSGNPQGGLFAGLGSGLAFPNNPGSGQSNLAGILGSIFGKKYDKGGNVQGGGWGW